MKGQDKEIDRVALAEQLFMDGYNCSQAVVAAFADIYGYTREQALMLSGGMGGGMGRMRMTCGAVSAMAILAGMACGATDAADSEGKSNNYKVVQELCNQFKQQYGSLICADLLKIKRDAPLSYIASPRTAEYYKTRPCVAQVVTAAKIFDQWLKQNS